MFQKLAIFKYIIKIEHVNSSLKLVSATLIGKYKVFSVKLDTYTGIHVNYAYS